MAQCNVTKCRSLQLGRPTMAGPWDSVMFDPLYAVSLMLLLVVAPGLGALSLSSSDGNICWNVLSGAPVSTLAFRVCSLGRPATLIWRVTYSSSLWSRLSGFRSRLRGLRYCCCRHSGHCGYIHGLLFLLRDRCPWCCCAGCLLPLRHIACQWPVRPQLWHSSL